MLFISSRMCVCVCVRVRVCACVFVCVYVNVCVYFFDIDVSHHSFSTYWGDISTPAKIAAVASPASASAGPQQTSALIFQPPKVGKIDLSPDDLLAVYHPATQGVVLITRKQYDAVC